MKTVALTKLKFDRYGTERFKFEADLKFGASNTRGLSLGGTLSDALAAKITLMIEEEVGEYAGAQPESTGLPPDENEDIPFWSMAPDCERCTALVARQGDHLCGACAEALGRDPRQPFWGDFANHPDSAHRFPAMAEMKRARDFVGVIDGMLAAPPWPKPRWSNPSLLTDEFKAFERRSAR